MESHNSKSKSERKKRRSHARNDNNMTESFDWTKTSSHYVSEDDTAVINRKLPKELLLRIFSFLDVISLCRCAQVSKYWNVLALDGSNWQRIDLFNFQKDIEAPVVAYMSARCGGFLKDLSLKGCESITDTALQIISQQCRHIESLILHKCFRITDATCESLGRYSQNLRKLDLSSCPEVTDLSLKYLSNTSNGQGCPKLGHLDVSWCQRVTNDGVVALAEGCPKVIT